MNYVAIIAAYIVTSLACIATIRSSNFKSPGFSDGALIGAAFYLVVPLAPIMLSEEISAFPMRVENYRPFEDVTTTVNLFVGMLALCVAAHASRIIRRQRDSTTFRRNTRAFTAKHFAVFIAIYAALAALTFLISGKAAGGHWMANMEATLSTDTRAILIANFKNAYRTAAFGLLVFLCERDHIEKHQALIFGIIIAIFDIALSFNRITFAYLAVTLLFIYRKHFWSVSSAFIVSIFPFAYLSNFWSTFRALALNDGLTFAGLERAALITNGAQGGASQGVSSILNSVFESSNIAVFNWIVKSVPSSFEPLWGSTMIVRPLTVLIPSTIWRDKPAVFGTMLGEQIQGMKGLALNSTLFGEAYANFSIWWVFVLATFVVLIDWIYYRLLNTSPAYSYCALFVGFACWRFDFAFTTISLVALGAFEAGRLIITKRTNSRI